MLPFDPANLEYVPLSAECPTGVFSCGERDIDRWIRKKATRSHDDFETRTTVVHAPGQEAIVGFYSLTHIVEEERRLPGVSKRCRGHFPALHLEWLAVRRDLQGNGLGEIVMGRVLDIFIQAAKASALPAFTLIAISERAERFYRELRFERYATNELGGGRRMIMLPEVALQMAERAAEAQRAEIAAGAENTGAAA